MAKKMKADGWLLVLVTLAVGCLCFGFVAQMNQYLIGSGVGLTILSGFGGIVYLFSIMRGNSHCYNVFFDYQRGKFFDRVCGIADDNYEVKWDPNVRFDSDLRFLHALISINESQCQAAMEVGKTWKEIDSVTIYVERQQQLTACLKDYTLVLFKFKKMVEFRDGKGEFDQMLCYIRRKKVVDELPRSDVSDEGEIYGIGRWTVLASSGGVEEIGRVNATTSVCRMVYSRADLQESSDIVLANYNPNDAVIKAGIAYNQDLLSAQTVGEAKIVAKDEETKTMEENWIHEVQRNKMLSGGAAGSIAQANQPPPVEIPAHNWKYLVGMVIGVILTIIFMLK